MKQKILINLIVLLLVSVQTLKAQSETQLETCRLIITNGIQNESLKQTIEKNVSDFLTICNTAVIKDKQPSLNKQMATEDARKAFSSIWKTSPMECSVSVLERDCIIRPAGGYQIRNIPVTMQEAPSDSMNDERNQEIVINLTADGKIDDIIIPINQYNKLLQANIEEEDTILRIAVLDFVENFRTSYNKKDLKYIGTLFSEDAIIIVGKELQKAQTPKSDAANIKLPAEKQNMYELTIKTKKEYLTSLSNVFKKYKYIDVNFDDIKVIRHPNPDFPVYGVTLKQDWKSMNFLNSKKDSYMDTGYLFLLINFTDKDHPVINVRTWQPDKYDGRDLRPDEIFKMSDFIY